MCPSNLQGLLFIFLWCYWDVPDASHNCKENKHSTWHSWILLQKVSLLRSFQAPEHSSTGTEQWTAHQDAYLLLSFLFPKLDSFLLSSPAHFLGIKSIILVAFHSEVIFTRACHVVYWKNTKLLQKAKPAISCIMKISTAATIYSCICLQYPVHQQKYLMQKSQKTCLDRHFQTAD